MVEATRKGVTSLGAEFLALEVAPFFLGGEGGKEAFEYKFWSWS